MKNHEKGVNIIWSISLLSGVMAGISSGMIQLFEVDFPRPLKLILATLELIVGIVLIITSILKLRKKQ